MYLPNKNYFNLIKSFKIYRCPSERTLVKYKNECLTRGYWGLGVVPMLGGEVLHLEWGVGLGRVALEEL